MKLFYLIVTLSISLFLNAQTGSDLLIFNTDGKVSLTRENVSFDKLQGEKILSGDIIQVSDGSITIINLNNKRISIDKAGTYQFDDISILMQKAEASLTNRYFVLVWKKMNKESKQVNKPGGVVRSDEFESFPLDSVIVLSDSIEFQISNKSDIEYTLIIKSEKHKEMGQYAILNSLKVNINDINGGTPGNYFWQVKSPFERLPGLKSIIIPDEETKNNLLDDYKQAMDDFRVFDDELKTMLLNEYVINNHLYIY